MGQSARGHARYHRGSGHQPDGITAQVLNDHHAAISTHACYDTIRYDTRCYFNVRSEADMIRLNLPHGDDN